LPAPDRSKPDRDAFLSHGEESLNYVSRYDT
jgi:hypothetical protein